MTSISQGVAKTPASVSSDVMKKKDGEDRFGQLRGFLVPLFRSQARIHGDK